MLEIVQPGQAGKTGLLFDMHRFRKRVFKDRLGWDVHISPGGLEIDNFDLPETIYLLALDAGGAMIGSWRLNPNNGPTMIRDLWPQFLASIDMPYDSRIWEASRFALDSPYGNTEQGMAQMMQAAQELFCGAAELGLLCGIEQIFSMYDMRIARLLKKLDCCPAQISEKLPVGGAECQVGRFILDEEMLRRLRAASGIGHSLVAADMIPPLFGQLMQQGAASGPIIRK